MNGLEEVLPAHMQGGTANAGVSVGHYLAIDRTWTDEDPVMAWGSEPYHIMPGPIGENPRW